MISGEVSIVQLDGKKLGCEQEDKLKPWVEYAENIVSQWATLAVEPDTGSQIGDFLNHTHLPNMLGVPETDSVLVDYDVKQAGTSSSSEHIRDPYFRQDHLRKCFCRNPRGPEQPGRYR